MVTNATRNSAMQRVMHCGQHCFNREKFDGSVSLFSILVAIYAVDITCDVHLGFGYAPCIRLAQIDVDTNGNHHADHHHQLQAVDRYEQMGICQVIQLA